MQRFWFVAWCLIAWSPSAQAAVSYTVINLGQGLATAISAEGFVVGVTAVPDATGQKNEVASLLAPLPQVLGTLPGGTMSRANSIRGERVVGYSSTGTLGLQTHAFLYTGGVFTDLGTLGSPGLFSAATDLNSVGTIAGYGDAPSGGTPPATRPIVFIGGRASDIGTLGGPSGFADAMNEQGDICGQSMTLSGKLHATVWPLGGDPVDLDTPTSVFSTCNALTNTGC
jgi:probable HAF family extracellular repeat protein